MGIFKRPDSKFWYYCLEHTPPGEQRKFKTDILIGTTTAQRHDSKRLADAIYHQHMNDRSKRRELPVEREAIRFAKYAKAYLGQTIAHHKGAIREEELLRHLVAYFGEELLTKIDQDRVRQYWTARKRATPAPSANTINRETDLLKIMLRDACPKYLAASPLVGMKRLKIIAPRRRYTSPEEFARLLKVCEDDQDRGILIIGRDGLARLGDLLDLKHTDRDENDRRLLWVGDSKQGGYEFALSERAEQAADALATNGSAYLFPKFRRAENERDWPSSVRQRLEYLCREADLTYGRAKNGITWHWLTRRSGAIDYVVKQERPIASVQKQGGWRNPETLIGIYNEARREDLLALVGQPAKAPRRRRRSA